MKRAPAIPSAIPHFPDGDTLELSSLQGQDSPRLDFLTKDTQPPSSILTPTAGAGGDSEIPCGNRLNLDLLSAKDFCTRLRTTKTTRCKYCTKEGRELRDIIKRRMYEKYERKIQRTYNLNVVNDIIYNVPTHIVAAFKDYLIYDDHVELIKGCCVASESREQLRKLCDFYAKYSKVFPNYIALEEKRYMFKNIGRKQKAIDQRQRALQNPASASDSKSDDRILTQHFIEQLSLHAPAKRRTGPATNPMCRLLEKFLENDSLSLLRETRCDSVQPSFVEKSVATTAPGRSVLARAENARKKSAVAHQAVSMARNMVPIPAAMTQILPIHKPVLLISSRPKSKPTDMFSTMPATTPGGIRRVVLTRPIPNVRIHENPQRGSRLDDTNKRAVSRPTPLRRYRSLERFEVHPDQGLFVAGIGRSSHRALLLRPRQGESSRQQRLRRVYSSPNVMGNPAGGRPRRTNKFVVLAADSPRNVAAAIVLCKGKPTPTQIRSIGRGAVTPCGGRNRELCPRMGSERARGTQSPSYNYRHIFAKK